jgi:hypothetical protein
MAGQRSSHGPKRPHTFQVATLIIPYPAIVCLLSSAAPFHTLVAQSPKPTRPYVDDRAVGSESEWNLASRAQRSPRPQRDASTNLTLITSVQLSCSYPMHREIRWKTAHVIGLPLTQRSSTIRVAFRAEHPVSRRGAPETG